MTRRTVWPLAIGLTCWAVAMVGARWWELAVTQAQIQASDLFMVSAQGPRLGSRAARPDIVFVFFDYKTAVDRVQIRSYTDDLRLYRRLLDAGARVIYDSRLVAAATPDAFLECQPLLDGILEIDPSSKILRDVWLSTSLDEKHGHLYSTLQTQNVIDSRPQAFPGIAARVYPLAYFTTNGVQESAPLVLYRKMHGLPKLTTAEVGDQLRSSGVMAKWHEFAPTIVPKTDVPQSNYHVGDLELTWLPFEPASVLIPSAGFWISYDSPLTGYERLSYIDVLNGDIPIDVQDKLVLIGFSANVDPSFNTFAVPNHVGKASTIEVMACAVQTLLDRRNVQAIPLSVQYLVALVFVVGMALVTGLAKPIQAVCGGIGLLVVYYLGAIVAYRYGWYADFFVTPITAIVGAIPAAVTNAWLNLRARQRVIDLFGRYVPRAIVNQLIQKSELQSLTLGGTQREVTVMFADIRGFTSFSQHLPPEQVVQELNSLLEVMVKCTFDYEGTLDKFIGDAILVLFNAPLDQVDHTLRAVKTAMAIQQRLQNHTSELKVGIGIHCGLAVIGNIGTPQRMEFTAIGRTVNIASRLCDLAAPGEIVISDTVTQAVHEKISVERIGPVTVKGISEALEVARVVDTLPESQRSGTRVK